LKANEADSCLGHETVSDDYWEPLWPGKPIVNGYKPTGAETAETWVNDKCQVYVYDYPSPEGWPPLVELSLKLNTREPWSDWRDFYRIKSELCGTACWAMELYPAQYALVDTANQYHMYVFAPGMHFPIGLRQPAVTDYSKDWADYMAQAKQEFGEEQFEDMHKRTRQRDWHEHHKCDDLPLIGPVWRSRGYFINDKDEIELGPPPPPPKPISVGPQDILRVALERARTAPAIGANSNGSRQNRKSSKSARRKNKRKSSKSRRSRK